MLIDSSIQIDIVKEENGTDLNVDESIDVCFHPAQLCENVEPLYNVDGKYMWGMNEASGKMMIISGMFESLPSIPRFWTIYRYLNKQCRCGNLVKSVLDVLAVS